LEPLSLLGAGNPNGHKVFAPGFDRALIASKQSALLEQLRKKYGRDRVPTTMTADDESEVVEDDAPTLQGPLGTRLRDVEGTLLKIAEAGVRRGEAFVPRLRELRDFFRRAGITEMAEALPEGDAALTAVQLLHAGYVSLLHRQVLASSARLEP
jgi:hypothetical protein